MRNVEIMSIGNAIKTDCTCTHLNGQRRKANSCSIHPLEKPAVFRLNSSLLNCRLCGVRANGDYHVCKPPEDIRKPPRVFDNAQEVKNDYCKCHYDRRGLRDKLSFDCEVHCK